MLLDFEQLDPEFLATNEVFSDEERRTYKQQRSVAQQNLTLLDAELALAEFGLEDNTVCFSERVNRKRRRKLVVLIAACNVALAPHKTLPTELLSYIFTLAFTEFPTYLPFERCVGTALVLCQTCSRWRRVALDTPDLWSDIVFRYEKGLDPYRTVDLVDEYFARCGSLKSLSLEISPWWGPEFPSNHEEIMQDVVRRLVVPYASRFWNLNLRLPESEVHSFLTMAHLTFPRLKSICLECDGSSSDPEFRSPVSKVLFPANTPLLTKIELCKFQYNLKVDDTFLPWNQLTRLYCHSTPIPIPQIHAILRQCRQLIECHLTVDTTTNLADISKTRIRLACLQRLSLSFTTQRLFVGLFLEPLYIPNIKELNFASTNFTTRVWPHEAALSLFNRCNNIEILQIDNISLSESIVSDIARSLPSLTTLLIGVGNLLPKDTLKSIAKGTILPKLRCLACKVDDLESAIQMLEYRCITSADADADSTFFMLDYSGEVINHDQAVRVDRLRAMGVGITMTRVQTL